MPRGGYRPNAGRPKAQHTIQAEAAKARLIEMFMEEKEPVFKALIKAAKEGYTPAIKELFDRVFGKVTEPIEVTGKDGKDLFPIPILANVSTDHGDQQNSEPQ